MFADAIGAAYGDWLDSSTLTEVTTTHGWTNENYFVSSHDKTRQFILRVNAVGTKEVAALRFEYALLEKMRNIYGVTIVPKIVPTKDDTFVNVPEYGLCVLFELCDGEHKGVIESTRTDSLHIVSEVAQFLGRLHTYQFENVTVPADRTNDVDGALGDEIIKKQRELLHEHLNDKRLQSEMEKNESLKTVISELVRLHGVFFPPSKDGTFLAKQVPISLVHNDFHYDNTLFNLHEHWELSGALDWELSYIGPSVVDVAMGLYFWCSCYQENNFKIDSEYARTFITTYEQARKTPLTSEEQSLVKRAMLVSIYWSVEFVTNPREDMMRKDLQARKYEMCLPYLQRYLSVLQSMVDVQDDKFLEFCKI